MSVEIRFGLFWFGGGGGHTMIGGNKPVRDLGSTGCRTV